MKNRKSKVLSGIWNFSYFDGKLVLAAPDKKVVCLVFFSQQRQIAYFPCYKIAIVG